MYFVGESVQRKCVRETLDTCSGQVSTHLVQKHFFVSLKIVHIVSISNSPCIGADLYLDNSLIWKQVLPDTRSSLEMFSHFFICFSPANNKYIRGSSAVDVEIRAVLAQILTVRRSPRGGQLSMTWIYFGYVLGIGTKRRNEWNVCKNREGFRLRFWEISFKIFCPGDLTERIVFCQKWMLLS